MQFPRVLFLTILFAALAVGANAAVYDFTYTVDDYVFDEDPPRGVTGDAPPGWGPGSWQGPAVNKSNFHISPASVGMGPVTLADIASVSFWTKGGASIPANDHWWFTIYTVAENDGSDSGSWYDSRLHARPDIGPGYSTSGVSGQWNKWSTDGGLATNRLVFYDSQRGFGGNYKTLTDVGAGPVDWDGDTVDDHDYSAEEIFLLTLQTDSGWDGFDGLVDGWSIVLDSEDVYNFNLEPNAVPVPAAVWLLGTGLVGLVGIRRKMRK